MGCFKDRTFCASPGCINKCGRKMTEQEREELDKISAKERRVSVGYFCEHNEENRA